MSERPLVSVIVPSYNHARFVEACLDSVVDDPYPAKELVVIDDGSTDNSAKLIRAWAERNADRGTEIRFEVHANHGLTRTLNELVSVAKGDYIANLASDDMLSPGGLEARVNFLQQHPEKRAVFGDCEVIDANGRRLMASGLADLHGVRIDRLRTALTAEIVGNWGLPGPVLMYRRDVIRELGGFTEGDSVEDWDMYLRFVSRGWLGFVDATVSRYRVHGGNIVLQPDSQRQIHQDLLRAAKRRSSEFGLLNRYRLVQRICSLNATIAQLEGGHARWLFWRALAGAFKMPLIAIDVAAGIGRHAP